MNRWQDISISDASLKAEFITKFFNGDYIDAFTIISNNPQLNTKAFVADTINQIATILLSLENNFQNGVIDYLSQQYSNFQNIIDNYNLKGNWSASTTYQIYNFVTYNNIDYLYINLTPSSGNLPTNTDYWVEINIQGEKGAPGLGVNLQYNWSATTPYNALDVVYYNNALWVARADNINKIPGPTEEWETLTGSIASFYNDGDIEITALSIAVEPVQDLHGYDSPWPAGGGKNVMPPAAAGSQERYGITVTSDGNGKYTCVGTATDSVTFSFSVPEFVIPPSAERTVCFMNSAAIGTFIFMNGNTVVDSWQLSNINRTAETYYAMANKTCNRIRIDFGGGTTVNMTLSPMFLAKNEDTSVFVPYSNECPISGWDAVSIWNKPTHATSADPTVTIQLGQTVYGGPLDVTGGTMTVDRVIIDCASITTWAIDKSAKRIYKIVSELAPASGAGVVADGLICNRFKSITANQIYANVEGVAISTGSALQFRINGLTDNPDVTLADVNSYFTANETKVVAKLATPITIQLDPVTISTLVGQNNVWSDAGDVSVELDKKYWEEFIEFKLASIYTDYIEPSGDNLYEGLIWFEVFNPQNWDYLTNRNYTWNQINANNDTWESVDRGDY